MSAYQVSYVVSSPNNNQSHVKTFSKQKLQYPIQEILHTGKEILACKWYFFASSSVYFYFFESLGLGVAFTLIIVNTP